MNRPLIFNYDRKSHITFERNGLFYSKYLILFWVMLFFKADSVIAQDNIYINTSGGRIYLVNTQTCKVSQKANTFGFYDIATNPVDGLLYGVNRNGLYRVDISTGSSVFVGPTKPGMFNALTFSSDGKLYGMMTGANGLYEIDTKTAATTFISDYGNYRSAGDLAFYGGDMYLATSSKELVKLNLKNPTSPIPMGRMNVQYGVFGLTTAGCSPKLYATQGSKIHKLDPKNLSSISLICPGMSVGRINGAASVYEHLPVEPINLGNDTSICEGESIRLAVNAIPNAKYRWSSGSEKKYIDVSTTGTYTVSVETSLCHYSDTINIKVYGPKSGRVVDSFICKGDSVKINYDSSFDFKWSDGSFKNTNTLNSAGTYWVKINSNDCSWVDTFIVKEESIMENIIDTKLTLCEGIADTIGSIIHGATYSWNTGDTTALIKVSQPGRYIVEVKKEVCKVKDTIDIEEINRRPVSLGSDTSLCSDEEIMISLEQRKNGIYTWQDGSNNLTYSITQSGDYWVEWNDPCFRFRDTIHVSAGDCPCNFTIPNIFTPNDDGINDTYMVQADCEVEHFDLRIYNRWGERLFQSNDITLTWDGSYLGKRVDNTVYFMILNYKTNTGVKKSIHGTVTVVQ